ncbi:MAG: response regulator [Acidobacteriota bacterium]|nr:response regulator [Acidobacteriota bacterium]
MIRPCFIVGDREFPGSISTRKLVIETAKFNVITAYSGHEAVETLARFPAANGVVLDSGLEDVDCAEIVRKIKQLQPSIPVILIAAPGFGGCPQADFILESFDPGKLLETLRSLKPEDAAAIDRHDEQLSHEKLR